LPQPRVVLRACVILASAGDGATRMDIGVEISLYPLKADFVPDIHEFLDRLSAHRGLRIVTNSMSTQVFGSYDEVMEGLRRELCATFEAVAQRSDKAVFVMKVLGPLPPA
jgi:uncharacterized protein YqgV (UPF0045/DUF77 family)